MSETTNIRFRSFLCQIRYQNQCIEHVCCVKLWFSSGIGSNIELTDFPGNARIASIKSNDRYKCWASWLYFIKFYGRQAEPNIFHPFITTNQAITISNTYILYTWTTDKKVNAFKSAEYKIKISHTHAYRHIAKQTKIKIIPLKICCSYFLFLYLFV